MSIEQRRDTRFPTRSIDIKICTGTSTTTGFISNISDGGLCIWTKKDIVYDCFTVIISQFSNKELPFNLSLKRRWSDLILNGSCFIFGCQYTTNSSDKGKQLVNSVNLLKNRATVL